MRQRGLLPVVGIIVGVAINASLIRTIGVTADHLYRERLLIERYGRDDSAPNHDDTDDEDDLDTEVARYIELAKADKRR